MRCSHSLVTMCRLSVCAGEAAADEAAAAVQSVLSGAVAGLVYRNALVAIPESLPFRAGFLDILRPYEFAGKADLQVQ